VRSAQGAKCRFATPRSDPAVGIETPIAKIPAFARRDGAHAISR
jgi:hypothetical protein